MAERSDFVVWIVDDDLAVRKSLEALLLVSGYRSQLFGSAEDFLQAVGGADDGCLLLDLHMPGLGGFGLMQALGPRVQATPVVVLTASRDETLHQRARSLGARAVLTKPVPRAILLAALEGLRPAAA